MCESNEIRLPVEMILCKERANPSIQKYDYKLEMQVFNGQYPVRVTLYKEN